LITSENLSITNHVMRRVVDVYLNGCVEDEGDCGGARWS
jgi:hypothetical protein